MICEGDTYADKPNLHPCLHEYWGTGKLYSYGDRGWAKYIAFKLSIHTGVKFTVEPHPEWGGYYLREVRA